MTDRDALLSAIVRNPADGLAWLALADWLEEDGQPGRAELLRLTRQLRDRRRRARKWPALEKRLCDLLAAGVRPCVPEWVNGVGMRFVLVPAGTFWMGSPDTEEGRDANEPLHEVTIDSAYWIGAHTVTQEQFLQVTGRNPSVFSASQDNGLIVGLDTSAFPVETVEWDDVDDYLTRLKAFDGPPGRAYRLPTEAEWEHACRAGTTTPYHVGPTISARQANMLGGDGSLGRPCPVGSYRPNAFGLYDTHGNVWEMCRNTDVEDAVRVLRGGCFEDSPDACRAAKRLPGDDDESVEPGADLGFRVVMVWRP